MSERGPEEPINRLVVVSNRLPVVVEEDPDRGYRVVPGSGGLVTAMSPVLSGRGGVWIGWPGATDERALRALREQDAESDVGYHLQPVVLTTDEVDNFYHGFANEVLWPLFHDMPDHCNFDPAYWPYYQQVNRKFALSVLESTGADAYVWFQDYHLLLGAQMLRELGVSRRTGHFLHIPFPPLDIFLKLPWRFQILQAMLEFDLLGFQTVRDRRNFFSCVRAMLPATRVTEGHKQVATLTTREREIRVGAFPIGIDYNEFAEQAATQEVSEGAWYIHENLPQRQLILGVDRLDYTKGIPQRIHAIGYLLQQHPELRGKITFIQVVVPSREGVPEYQALKAEIERLVGEINGQFTVSGWTPIHYIYRSLPRANLLAYYRTCEVALVTPLKDGMNLVAKEYCASSLEDNGVLIMSEFAGSAAQMQDGALLVNPYDIAGVADALHQALKMPQKERAVRMRRMRRGVQRQDVFWWVDSILRAAISKDLSHFPRVSPFVPQAEEQLVGAKGAAGRTAQLLH